MQKVYKMVHAHTAAPRRMVAKSDKNGLSELSRPRKKMLKMNDGSERKMPARRI